MSALSSVLEHLLRYVHGQLVDGDVVPSITERLDDPAREHPVSQRTAVENLLGLIPCGQHLPSTLFRDGQ